MRIRLSELPEAVRLPSVRPPSVRPSSVSLKDAAAVPTDAVSVMLSSEVRALVAGLTRGLPEVGTMDLYEILSHDDRRMISVAAELAAAQGFDPVEVEHLAADLAHHAMSSGALVSAKLAATLTLPVLSEPDEALAREVLARVSARNVPLNVGFVQAMLDPSAASTRTVSLAFLRSVVLTMAPTPAEPSTWARAVYARREARVELSRALATLALPASALAKVTAEVVSEGTTLLRARADVVAQQTNRTTWSALTQLTRNDRALAGVLYVAQQQRGGDPRVVDDVVRSLMTLRVLERAAAPRHTERHTDPPRAPSLAPGLMRSYSDTQLAARVLGAYRSLTPPSFEAELVHLPPSISLDLARALGLSELIGGIHAQSLRLRRRQKLRARDLTLATVEAIQREQGSEVESQDTAAAARNARWRRLAKRRRRAPR